MVYGNFHAIFDPQVYKDYMVIVGKGNIRRTIEEHMMNVIAVNQKDATGIDIKLINMDIEKLTKKLSGIQAELQNKMELKEKYEANKMLEEETRLQTEKEKIESQKKCINCGNMIPEGTKSHTFPKGNVCNACFMSAGLGDDKKWM